MKQFKRKKSATSKTQSGINVNKNLVEKLSKERIAFSYKYLELTHKKFNVNSNTIDKKYFIKLKDRLKAISDKTVDEFKRESYNNKLHCHLIDWEKSSETCFGIPNEDQIVDQPWQFAISVNKYGRIHGFFIGNVFFIVWLDADHKLHSRK